MRRGEVTLADSAGNGLHEVPAPDLEACCAAAVTAGLFCARLDLAACRDKSGLLAALAEALHFPDWFGHNWDALADCLDDLQWLPGQGVVLVLEHTGTLRAAAPQAYRLACEILAEAAAGWRQRERPFHVLLAVTPPRRARRTRTPSPTSRQDPR